MLSELDDYAHGQKEKKALVKNTNKSVCSAHFDGFSSDLVLETLTVGLYNMTHRKMKEIWFRFFSLHAQTLARLVIVVFDLRSI